MSAHSLPRFLKRATVTRKEESDLSVMVWVLPEGAAGDGAAIAVRFVRDFGYDDEATIEIAVGLEPGGTVEVGFVEITDMDGRGTRHDGRSIIKTGGE